MSEVFYLYIGGKPAPNPSVIFNKSRSELYSIDEMMGRAYDALWDAAEGGEPLPEDFRIEGRLIRADKVTWEQNSSAVDDF